MENDGEKKEKGEGEGGRGGEKHDPRETQGVLCVVHPRTERIPTPGTAVVHHRQQGLNRDLSFSQCGVHRRHTCSKSLRIRCGLGNMGPIPGLRIYSPARPDLSACGVGGGVLFHDDLFVSTGSFKKCFFTHVRTGTDVSL